PVGNLAAQVFMSTAEEGTASMRLMYLMAMAAARKSILLSSAYFVPDTLAVDQFVKARERGVKIQIIVPGPHTDAAVVKVASRGLWGKLLEAGVEIYEYQPTMFHCKVMIVDDFFVSVGSTNFDDRSFRKNDEANLNIFDEQFALAESKTFQDDLAQSKRVTLQDWKDRPVKEKVLEKFALILKDQL
ncbi:MAG: phospholipase D-like domain-containing protein, partial [Bdellovibrionota bacterium]